MLELEAWDREGKRHFAQAVALSWRINCWRSAEEDGRGPDSLLEMWGFDRLSSHWAQTEHSASWSRSKWRFLSLVRTAFVRSSFQQHTLQTPQWSMTSSHRTGPVPNTLYALRWSYVEHRQSFGPELRESVEEHWKAWSAYGPCYGSLL